MLHNSPNESYLEIWHQTFTINKVMAECQSIMHIFEILVIVPFMNAIVECLFSQMNRVNTDFPDRLWRSRLDTCLHVGEEGPNIKGVVPVKKKPSKDRKKFSNPKICHNKFFYLKTQLTGVWKLQCAQFLQFVQWYLG